MNESGMSPSATAAQAVAEIGHALWLADADIAQAGDEAARRVAEADRRILRRIFVAAVQEAAS